MIDSMPPTEVANAERFERFGLDADAGAVARIAPGLHGVAASSSSIWTRSGCSDLVLAINEATGQRRGVRLPAAPIAPGTIDIQAAYDPGEQTLTVLSPTAAPGATRQIEPAPRTRGRGIPLMETLADDATIETVADGTRCDSNGTASPDLISRAGRPPYR